MIFYDGVTIAMMCMFFCKSNHDNEVYSFAWAQFLFSSYFRFVNNEEVDCRWKNKSHGRRKISWCKDYCEDYCDWGECNKDVVVIVFKASAALLFCYFINMMCVFMVSRFVCVRVGTQKKLCWGCLHLSLNMCLGFR